MRGHIPYGYDLTEGDYKYITFVRDPLERLFHINFAITMAAVFGLMNYLPSNKLEEYLCEGTIGHDNYLRYLSGTDFQLPVNRII